MTINRVNERGSLTRPGLGAVFDIEKKGITVSRQVMRMATEAQSPPKIIAVGFGLGKFVKNFVAANLAAMGDFGYVAQVVDPELIKNFNEQDGLYIDAVCSPSGEYELKLMGALRHAFDISQPEEVKTIIDTMIEPGFQYAFLTHTKNGYFLRDDSDHELDLSAEPLQQDMAGGITTTANILLRVIIKRRKRKLPPIVVLSCDNEEVKPDRWLAYYAEHVWPKNADLAQYILDHVPAPETMVDSITIGNNVDLQEILASKGIEDPEANAHEKFRFGLAAWDDKWDRALKPTDLPFWETVSKDEIEALREAKRVMVNSVHFGIAMVGATAGIPFIENVMGDPSAKALIGDLIESYRQTLNALGNDLGKYAEPDPLARFAIPMKDTVARVGRNPVMKMNKYVFKRAVQANAHGKDTEPFLKLTALWILWNYGDSKLLPTRIEFDDDDRKNSAEMQYYCNQLMEAVLAREYSVFARLFSTNSGFASIAPFACDRVYEVLCRLVPIYPLNLL